MARGEPARPGSKHLIVAIERMCFSLVYGSDTFHSIFSARKAKNLTHGREPLGRRGAVG